MVAKRQCSFCAQEIEPGTGTIFVKRDGTVFQFCSSSCRKQQLHLGRIGHRFKWTRAYELKRTAERSSAARSAGASSRTEPPRPAPEPVTPAAPDASVPSPIAEQGPAPAEQLPAAAGAPAEKKPRSRAPAKASRKAGAKPAAKAAAGASADDA